jgi:hypothetical protein
MDWIREDQDRLTASGSSPLQAEKQKAWREDEITTAMN